jgi:hypothetical protein
MASARVDKLIPAMKEALGKFAAVSCGPNSKAFPEWSKICWADFLRSFGFSFKRMAAAPPQVPRTLTRGYSLCALHFTRDTLWYENAQSEWQRLAEDYANPHRVFERVMRSRRAQAAATGRPVPMDPYEDAEGVRAARLGLDARSARPGNLDRACLRQAYGRTEPRRRNAASIAATEALAAPVRFSSAPYVPCAEAAGAPQKPSRPPGYPDRPYRPYRPYSLRGAQTLGSFHSYSPHNLTNPYIPKRLNMPTRPALVARSVRRPAAARWSSCAGSSSTCT